MRPSPRCIAAKLRLPEAAAHTVWRKGRRDGFRGLISSRMMFPKSASRTTSIVGRLTATDAKTGSVGSGLFARFGGGFEGFLPARLLGGDFFELNCSAPPRGPTHRPPLRLGDPIEVLVGSIDRADGKVSLRLA